jgi:membrane fusion protein, multidrug efflux system
MSETHEDIGFELPAAAKFSRGRVVVIIVLVIGGAFGFGYYQHKKAGAVLDEVRSTSTTLHVETFAPKSLQSDQALALPGVILALEETKIYPHTSGYVKRWLVDLGDKVKDGDLLVEIAAPDLDAQLVQARAQLVQARAALQQALAQHDYSKANADRNVEMKKQQLIATATVEQAVAQEKTDAATIAVDQANIASMDANVKHLAELQGFERVTAPYAGTITSRTIERGTLVGDTTTATTATPMYSLAAVDPVRIYVDVPQTVAPSVRDGAAANILVREFPGRTFTGKVTRSAGELDPDLHTMRTEIRVPNPDSALMPGMYVTAQLTLPVPHRVLEIPATALYNDAQGVRVAIVDAQNKIRYMKIVIERDTGATLWVSGGLTGDERVVKIAVPTLVEGDSVDASAAKPPAAAAPGK